MSLTFIRIHFWGDNSSNFGWIHDSSLTANRSSTVDISKSDGTVWETFKLGFYFVVNWIQTFKPRNLIISIYCESIVNVAKILSGQQTFLWLLHHSGKECCWFLLGCVSYTTFGFQFGVPLTILVELILLNPDELFFVFKS